MAGSALCSAQFTNESASADLRQWLITGSLAHPTEHARDLPALDERDQELALGSALEIYVAPLRIADDFGLDAEGIQYQQGLKGTVPVYDVAEGLLNNVERPPVRSRDGVWELFAGRPVPHFNEVDEGATVDALITNGLGTVVGLDPAATLHDSRWDEAYVDESLSGCCKPGEIVWSRASVDDAEPHADIGRGHVLELPVDETRCRLEVTTPQWPIMRAVLNGIGGDQLMAKNKATHLQVAYARNSEVANSAAAVKAAMFGNAGLRVHLRGDVALSRSAA